MSTQLASFEAIAKALEPTEDILFGVKLEATAVGATPEEDSELSLSNTGLFLIRDELVSFRIQLAVEADLFVEATIDVASNFQVEKGVSFAREPFFEFANSVAASHLRSYAQLILDGLLVQMKLPPKLLPPASFFETPTFKTGRFPDYLDAERFAEIQKHE